MDRSVEVLGPQRGEDHEVRPLPAPERARSGMRPAVDRDLEPAADQPHRQLLHERLVASIAVRNPSAANQSDPHSAIPLTRNQGSTFTFFLPWMIRRRRRRSWRFRQSQEYAPSEERSRRSTYA